MYGVPSALIATLKASQDAILITVGGKEQANKKNSFRFPLVLSVVLISSIKQHACVTSPNVWRGETPAVYMQRARPFFSGVHVIRGLVS
jgi:hypothetical protein